MKNLMILLALTLLSIQVNAAGELQAPIKRTPGYNPVNSGFYGPYLYTLFVEVGAGPTSYGMIVKAYHGIGKSEFGGYFAARQSCINDSNSEKVCDKAWIQETHPQGIDPIRKGF